MHKNVNALAYNVRDGFGDPGRSWDLLKFVSAQNPGVAFFSEAYREGADIDEAKLILRGLGYQVTSGLYGDDDGRKDRHGFMGISRLPTQVNEPFRFGTRTGYHMVTEDGGLEVFGLHADDRTEEGRLHQIGHLPQRVGPKISRIVLGDLNAMHRWSPQAIALRPLRRLARLLPSRDPDPDNMPTGLPRFGSKLQRLTEMASGKTMRALARHGLRDGDPERRSTMGRFQLDHIMVSSDITIAEATVHQDVNLSDHKPVSARLIVPERALA